MDAAEYKHLVLGLIFLKYISDTFAERAAELARASPIRSDDYFLDAEPMRAANWKTATTTPRSTSSGCPRRRAGSPARPAKQPDIGKRIDEALDAIEAENPKLKGILDKRFARAQLDRASSASWWTWFDHRLRRHGQRARDVLGEVYEYFLGMFASAEGKKGGQFYTPAASSSVWWRCSRRTRARSTTRAAARAACSCRARSSSRAHGGKLGDVSIFGQEANPTTWRLAAMNLAIRGIDFDLGREPADTFPRDQHPDLRADFILANPPFNISDWWHASADGRRALGVMAPAGGQRQLRLAAAHPAPPEPGGRAGIVLANGSA